MIRYVAVDSGKFATKYATYDEANQKILKNRFRTKISPGRMDDDEIEAGTFIMEYEGNVYKIGNGASSEAEMVTSKTADIHRLCTIAAIAMYIGNEEDLVHVCVGAPLSVCENRQSKLTFKRFILPDPVFNEKKSNETGLMTYDPSELIEVKLRLTSDSMPVTKRFRIASKMVRPESSGVLYLDPTEFAEGTTAVLDIGNLNINGSIWNAFECDNESSITDELGGSVLIAGLSKKLSQEFSRCDQTLTARVLKKPWEERMLIPKVENTDIPERSLALIHEYCINHVKAIKRECDERHWSLDFMKIACIGGTTSILEHELKEVFGQGIYIPESPEYVNVLGFLKFLYVKRTGHMITEVEKDVAA